MSKKESEEAVILEAAQTYIKETLDAYKTYMSSSEYLNEMKEEYKIIREQYYKCEKEKYTPESVLNTIIIKFQNINYVNLISLQEFFDEKTLNAAKNINSNHFEDYDEKLDVMYALYSITLYLYNLSPITESDTFLFNLQNIIKHLNRIAYPILTRSSVNSEILSAIKDYAQECYFYMNLNDD